MKRAIYRAVVAGVLATGLVAQPVAAEDYYDGLRAYETGDHGSAARIWRQAADAGDATAQFRLGQLYEQGEGVERNYVEALRWYLIAQERGNADAGVAAYFLRRNMTEVQRREATQQASLWTPSTDSDVPPVERASVPDDVITGERIESEPEQQQATVTERPENSERPRERLGDIAPPENRQASTGYEHRPGREQFESWGERSRREQDDARYPDREPYESKLRAMVAGAEIRRTEHYGSTTRYDLWLFRRNGRVRGSFSAVSGHRGQFYDEGRDRGWWEIRGRRLCITWQHWSDGEEHCYRVTLLGHGRWRISHIAEDGDERYPLEDRMARRWE